MREIPRQLAVDLDVAAREQLRRTKASSAALSAMSGCIFLAR
jgi:hypothetical protein